jgi:hypothetical protein
LKNLREYPVRSLLASRSGHSRGSAAKGIEYVV